MPPFVPPWRSVGGALSPACNVVRPLLGAAYWVLHPSSYKTPSLCLTPPPLS